jgi:hypothetical protein
MVAQHHLMEPYNFEQSELALTFVGSEARVPGNAKPLYRRGLSFNANISFPGANCGELRERNCYEYDI